MGLRLAREQDAAKAAEIEAWLELVAQSCNVMPLNNLTVLTRNVTDFRQRQYGLADWRQSSA